jgi:hypothetical protein
MDTTVCGAAEKAVQETFIHLHDTLSAFTKASEVGSSMVIEKEQALAIYNQVATKCEQPNLDVIGSLFAVEVQWSDGTILLTTDVEANTEEDAVDLVRDGLEIDAADLKLALRYGKDSGSGTIYNLEWDLDNLINESLEYRATEL